MSFSISRRDFIKLAGMLPFLFSFPYLFKNRSGLSDDPNILIIVFDALSSHHLSTYGYSRETMPHLDKFLSRSTVFHNHYSSAPFTTPGTASLLTGTYSLTHRALNRWGLAAPAFAEKNIFSLFQDYYSVAYTHNPLAALLLDQFGGKLDQLKPRQDLYLKEDILTSKLFGADYDSASRSKRQILVMKDGDAYSLFFPTLFGEYQKRAQESYLDRFPRGITMIEDIYMLILEDAINWLGQSLPSFPQPFLGYFHFWPPHSPYNTRREFVDLFKGDGNSPQEKPRHILSQGESEFMLNLRRRQYDEFILYVDAEFKRLYDHLENSGLLENTWLVFTSDHGEMFERGFFGHTSPSLHQPVLQVPLFISAPGQRSRQDIYSATSSVDLVPTFLHLTGRDIPDWVEGQVLPPYREAVHEDQRSIYALMAANNAQFSPLTEASAMVQKNDFKLVHYFGYQKLDGKPLYELFNLAEDPAELQDVSQSYPDIFNQLKAELASRIHKSNSFFSDK